MKLPPDPDKVYVLTCDVTDYSAGTFAKDNPVIPRGTRVTNVHLDRPEGMLEEHFGGPFVFQVVGETKLRETHYDYVFAEETDANLWRLHDAWVALSDLRKAEARYHHLRSLVDGVCRPGEKG